MSPAVKKPCSRTSFYRYLNTVSDCRVRCPKCNDVMSLREFHKIHASTRHDLNPSKQCIFCFGRLGWKFGEKQSRDTVKHIEQCVRDFVKDHRETDLRVDDDASSGERSSSEVKEAISVCPCSHFESRPRDMAGRIVDGTSRLVGFYDSVFEKPEVWQREGFRFDKRSGLGDDVYGIVHRFLYDQSLKWMHAMVKHSAFDAFVRAMTPIRDEFVVLPYWCLCDGLTNDRGEKVTHRHMIVAYEKESSFETVWKEKVRLDLPGEKAKTCVKMTKAYHLIRTIAYVSTPRASCDRGIPEGLKIDDGDEAKGSHFYINRPISEHAVAFLATLLPDGIETLLSEQLRNKWVVDWMEAATFRPAAEGKKYKKWFVPIRETGWKFLNCVIPVDRCYEPTTEEETPLVLHLYGGKKLYFKKNPELANLPLEEWYAHQARRGNTFRSIRDEMYALGFSQQKTMNQVERAREKTEMRRDLYWKPKLKKIKEENIAVIEKERESFKRKLEEEVEKEREALKTELEKEREALKTELEKEREALKRIEEERDALKKKLDEVEQKKDLIRNNTICYENLCKTNMACFEKMKW